MIPFPDKKYQIIYADPPWRYSSRIINGSGNIAHNVGVRGLQSMYKTLSENELMTLPVQNIADDKCILFIWTTNAHLETCINVINAWGFKYRTVAFIWNKKEQSGKQVKQRGFYTTSGSELCFLASHEKSYQLIKSRKENQIVESEVMNHSSKPKEVRDRIERMCGDLPRIELFARQKTEGWDVWGNEV